MLPGEFLRKIQRCNSRLIIIASQGAHLPSGLYLRKSNLELAHLCGVDSNEIPERQFVFDSMRICKRGWRKVVNILIGKRLVKRSKAESVFRTRFHKDVDKLPIIITGHQKIDLQAEITKQSVENSSLYGNKYGNTLLSRDQLADFAAEIRKRDE